MSSSRFQVVIDVSPNYPHVKLDLKSFESEFESIENIIQDGRNTIKRTYLGTTDVVIKSFKKPNRLQGFIYKFFRQSKARRSYSYALKLLQKGICTPSPVAFIEVFDSKRLLQSYYISEYFNHDFRIRDVVENKVSNKKLILEEFTIFTHKMHQQSILHLDYSTGNILIKNNGDNYEFAVVDINRLKFGKVTMKQGVCNLNRISNDIETVEILADDYAKYAGLSSSESRLWLNGAIKSYRSYLSRKKKLKKLITKIT